MALNGSINRRGFEWRLFAVAALMFPLIVLAGFARTYYCGFVAKQKAQQSLPQRNAVLDRFICGEIDGDENRFVDAFCAVARYLGRMRHRISLLPIYN
jgi:hypothetical protein